MVEIGKAEVAAKVRKGSSFLERVKEGMNHKRRERAKRHVTRAVKKHVRRRSSRTSRGSRARKSRSRRHRR